MISFVATSRNDSHGEDLLHRMQCFVDHLSAQCRRYNLNAELIIVEWNPPPDKPRLHEALEWPLDTGPCSIRIIEVPPEIHEKHKYSNHLSLFQFIAKNVGIRRAHGKFVLATNIDILFSDEVISYLSRNTLRTGHIYRADRYDVSSDIPTNVPTEEQLLFCLNNVIRINYREGIINKITGDFYRIYSPFPFFGKGLHWLPGWKNFLRFRKYKFFRLPFRFFRFYREWLGLDICASGDFTMMSKKDWSTLRGYPELEAQPLHIDSLLCFMAHYAGIKEVSLELPIFHIEHPGGWTPETDHDQSYQTRLSKSGVPQLTTYQLDKWIKIMNRKKRPISFNNKNWGLADFNLREESV